MWSEIVKAISEKTGQQFQLENTLSIGGGCINQAYKLVGKNKSYFVKLNTAVKVEMFAVEALGLKQMYETQTITIPQPICWGVSQSNCYLVLEYYDFGRGNQDSWRNMGRQLALMHDKGVSTRFGWQENNTIGSTPQINDWYDNWGDFFAQKRIGYQLQLARRNGGSFANSNEAIEKIRDLLSFHSVTPALVHGDLWSGNASITVDGQPIIFDPACYYGDREVDLAMSELFGGFPSAFYQGYQEIYPLDSGYEQRKTIYNLYHILNHFNLFGGGYQSQSQRMIKQIMSF